MTDPADDDALSWAGDDRLQAPRERAPRLIVDRPEDGGGAGGGPIGLVALGILGGVALVETGFWLSSVLAPSIAATVTPGTGTPAALAAYGLNLAFRGLTVAAPAIWFAVVLASVRAPSRRLALLALGAVVLVPWPAILSTSS